MSTKDATKEKEELKEPDTQPGPAQDPALQEINLSIQDLQTAMQIIAIVSARGGFKPEELAVVGALYQKLHAFLDASGALAAAANEKETTADPAATDGTTAA